MTSIVKSKWAWLVVFSILCIELGPIINDRILSRPSYVIGLITDSNGSQATGIRLILIDSINKEHKTTTDEGGKFEFENIPVGKFILKSNNELLVSGDIPTGWNRLISNITDIGIINYKPNQRVINFKELQWIVKSGCGLGPGPNCWSDRKESVWVDGAGQLHLQIYKVDNQWYSAEVISAECAPYGVHSFTTSSRLDNLDKNIIAAFFLYKDDQSEIDIEFARWGEENPISNAHYAVQPSDTPENHLPFLFNQKGRITTHYIEWNASSIYFGSFNGPYPLIRNEKKIIYEWLYRGNNIPKENQCLNIHISLWLYQGIPPSDNEQFEIIITDVYTELNKTQESEIAK